MVPLVDVDPGFTCLELPGGRIIDWDPELTSEYQDARGWAKSFREVTPSFESWLDDWVRSRTPAEERAASMEQLRRDEMRRTRERIAAMTPEERAAIGLPDEGWEDAFIKDED